MSVTTEKTLFCDDCGNWTYGTRNAPPFTTARELRAGAKDEGWKRENGRDLCPGCLDDSPKMGARK